MGRMNMAIAAAATTHFAALVDHLCEGLSFFSKRGKKILKDINNTGCTSLGKV